MNMIVLIKILVLAFIQNVSFSITSRSRNRDNMQYHVIAAVFSNGLWLLTIKELIAEDFTNNFWLAVPYVIGTVTGSLVGAKLSMWIENLFNISADGHLNKKVIISKSK